jgi:hypothetical protein
MTFDISFNRDNLDGDGNQTRNSNEPNYDLILSSIPINVIEKFLRKKKLENLNKK